MKTYKSLGFETVCGNFDFTAMQNIDGIEIIVDRHTGKCAVTSLAIVEVYEKYSLLTWFDIEALERIVIRRKRLARKFVK